MSTNRWRLLALMALAAAPWAASAQPHEAITYVETQLRSDALQGGRKLTTNGSAFYGIDVNSSVTIDVDNAKLTAQLVQRIPPEALTEREAALAERMDALRSSIDAIEPVARSLVGLFDTWARAEDTGSYQAFLEESATVDTGIANLMRTLVAAIQRRLEAGGLAESAARRRAEQALDPVYTGASGPITYDWDALRELYQAEIRAVESELAAIADGEGLAIEIQGHLLAAGAQQGLPIHLPGYNQVATGPSSVFQKIRYDIPPEALVLRDKYQSLAATIEEQDELGQALLEGLKTEYTTHEAEIRALLASAGELKAALDGLGEWRDRDRRREWFDGIDERVAATGGGQAVVNSWTAAQAQVDAIEADFAALQALADLRSSLGSAATPEAALSRIKDILGSPELARAPAGELPPVLRVLDPDVWAQRIQSLTSLVASVGALGPDVRAELLDESGPVADFVAVEAAGRAFVSDARAFPANARAALFGSLSLDAIELATELPVPVGQVRLGLAADANVDTSFDLKTIRETRQPGNEIWISYRFFRGETDLGLGWRDKFLIGVYGWQDHVAVGLAFAKGNENETWKPTANLSWLLKKQPWPENGQTGLERLDRPEWYSGFGLSTMPLDLETDEDVEVGVALTGSFLNDRIIVGYGANLQGIDNDRFWFISVRLFQQDGIMKNLSAR